MCIVLIVAICLVWAAILLFFWALSASAKMGDRAMEANQRQHDEMIELERRREACIVRGEN